MDSHSSDPLARARQRIIDELSPVAPPNETIAAIRAVAKAEGVGAEDQPTLIRMFLEHHEIDPGAPSPVAILRGGHQVLSAADDATLLEDLLNAIIGESTVALSDQSVGGWGDSFVRFRQELVREADHVSSTLHHEVVRALLRELLGQAVVTKSDEYVVEAFPQLRVSARTIEEFVASLKQGAVLVLGKDTGDGLALLQRIAHILERNHGKTPLLLKKQRDHEDLGLIAKLLVNTSATRWVLVENTESSGHLFELPLVDMAKVIVAVLQRKGAGASVVPDEAILTNARWQRFTYTSDGLEAAVKAAVDWAEAQVDAAKQAHRVAGSWEGPGGDRT